MYIRIAPGPREPARARDHNTVSFRHRLNGYLAQRVPSLLLASSFRKCLNCAVLKCVFSPGPCEPARAAIATL